MTAPDPIQSLARAVGTIQAIAQIALARAKYSDVITDERDLLAKALADIVAVCESPQTPGSAASFARVEATS